MIARTRPVQVCHKCEKDIDMPCENCGPDKEKIFHYASQDEPKGKVISDFVEYILTDKTMDNR